MVGDLDIGTGEPGGSPGSGLETASVIVPVTRIDFGPGGTTTGERGIKGKSRESSKYNSFDVARFVSECVLKFAFGCLWGRGECVGINKYSGYNQISKRSILKSHLAQGRRHPQSRSGLV